MTDLVLSGVTKSFGAAPVVDAVDLSISQGESVVLLGPSGCGKTTCLRLIAGFERPDAGEIRLRDRTLAGPLTFVPPERRQMSVVFQSYALWPHLDVRQNVEYGPRTARVPRPEVRRRVDAALDMVQLDALGDRYAHQLSGGQQQRVALARALVNDPVLLLLDEPLSNLDTRLREEMRSEIKRLHHSLGMTMVYVTHDQAEALSLADRLVVLDGGRVVQVGVPEEVYRRPRTGFVARALGATNLMRATVGARPGSASVALHLPGGVVVDGARPADDLTIRAGDEVMVSLRPHDIRLSTPTDTRGGAATVVESLFFGDHVQYTVDVRGAAPLRVSGPGTGQFAVGDEVDLVIEPGRASVVDDPPPAPTAATPAPRAVPTA